VVSLPRSRVRSLPAVPVSPLLRRERNPISFPSRRNPPRGAAARANRPSGNARPRARSFEFQFESSLRDQGESYLSSATCLFQRINSALSSNAELVSEIEASISKHFACLQDTLQNMEAKFLNELHQWRRNNFENVKIKLDTQEKILTLMMKVRNELYDGLRLARLRRVNNFDC